MTGVKKMMVVLDVRERRRRGTEAERKRTSSVTGPCTETSEIFHSPRPENAYCHKVTPAYPVTNCSTEATKTDPSTPPCLHNSCLKERSQEENGSERKPFYCFLQTNRKIAQNVK